MIQLSEMLSTTARYALRTVGFLASSPDRWVIAKEVAAGTGIPVSYLSKILAKLRRHELVRSQKGRGGGFQLLPRSSGMPIGAVLEIFEGRRDATACALGPLSCDATDPCPLHAHWVRVRGEVDQLLGSVRLEDLAAAPAK